MGNESLPACMVQKRSAAATDIQEGSSARRFFSRALPEKSHVVPNHQVPIRPLQSIHRRAQRTRRSRLFRPPISGRIKSFQVFNRRHGMLKYAAAGLTAKERKHPGRYPEEPVKAVSEKPAIISCTYWTPGGRVGRTSGQPCVSDSFAKGAIETPLRLQPKRFRKRNRRLWRPSFQGSSLISPVRLEKSM